MVRPLLLAASACVAALAATGCDRGTARAPERPGPTRGYLLVSLDTLGADHLGAYGARRDTSPFFDRLARRGVLFEQAFAQYPSTLVSHVSLFTGLYPQEHGVYPPSKVVSPELEMLPERFSNFGYLTAGHTEGGFVARHFGFHRGFDEFSDPRIERDTDIERTFERGLEFLRRLGPDDRFFLFLHSYSAHDPYEPPAPFDALFQEAGGPAAFESTGANIRSVNQGFLAADAATGERFAALYDAGVRYIDSVLESFFTELDRLGLTHETTVVITSDHGEEFLEHGRLGHSQVYPESLRVPLLVLHPAVGGRRVPELVELVDVAPTLYELARLPPPAILSGKSLVPYLEGRSRERTWAYAEVADGRTQRTLLRREGGATHQLIVTRLPAERDGTWVTRRAGLEVETPAVELSLVSFQHSRPIRVLLDGRERRLLEIGTDWTPVDLDLPAGRERYRLDLVTDGCDSPRRLGLSEDPRCLSFKVRGVEVRLGELFRLDRDPLASTDLGSSRPALHRELTKRLAGLAWSNLESPQSRQLTEETADALRALGYIE